MTSCEGVILPREQGELVFHGPRGGIDESVMANGMENVAPGHAMIATDAQCKSLRCRFALLSINEHSVSDDGFCAVPAVASAVATLSSRFTPLMLAGSPVDPVVTGMYADDKWDYVEVARGPVDPMWRNHALDYACTRQYSGADVNLSYAENEAAIMQYQIRVGQAIKLSQGPRTFKACIDMTATYCAVALCAGRAQAVVSQFLDLNRRLPTMRELFFLLDEDVYTLYVSVSFADQKHQRKVPDVIGSSSETVSSQEEEDPQEEVSSALPGHRWIPPYIYEESDFGENSDVAFNDDFGSGF
jgi:hypothetical protein